LRAIRATRWSWTSTASKADPIIFEIDYLVGRLHLPVIRVRRAV
jgi:hypothetical protein